MKKTLFTILILSLLTSCEFVKISVDPNHDDVFSESDYVTIDMENYPEWEYGIMNKDNSYLFVKQDATTGEYIAYFNNELLDDEGVMLHFDKDLRLHSFVTTKGVCNIYWTGEEIANLQIITTDSVDYIENVNIPTIQYNETRVAWLPIAIAIAKGVNVAMTVGDFIEGTNALLSGDLQNAGWKFAEALLGGAIPSSKPFKELLMNISMEGLEELKNYLDNKAHTLLLGDCQISIDSNKIAENKYEISLSVSGYETLPIINKATGERCVVFAGLVTRKGWSYVTYSTNDDRIGEFIINKNGTKKIIYELPEHSTYYVAPYLLPTRKGTQLFTNYVRHGNTIKLEYFNGNIDSFNQLSYTIQDRVVTFNCTAHATCHVDDGQRWKLYYENDLGNKIFYDSRTYEEPSISTPNTADFGFQINFQVSHIINGQKKIKLGLAIFNENNQLLIASEPKIYILTYESMALNAISYKDNYYYYENDGTNYIAYNCTANISGNTSAIENFSSCGIYYHNSNTGKNYIWKDGLSGNYNNEDIDFFIGINISNFDKLDNTNYYAEATYYGFGVYVEFNDGTYYMSEPKPCKFIYDKKPSYKYLSVGHMTVSVIGSYEDKNGETIKQYSATHPYSYAVNGALWIEYAQGIVEGGSWQDSDTGTQYRNPWYPNKDKEYSSTTTLTYYSSSNMHHTVYSKIVAKSGETIFSNSLVYGGSPENPTVSIGGTRALSVVVNDNNKIYSSMADVMSCGNIDGMAIPDIEVNKNKVMTIDDLKEIPTNKVIH